MFRNAARYVCAGGPGVAVLFCAAALCSPAAEKQLVVVINRAGIEPKMLAVAQEDVTRIFGYAGIDLSWEGCRSRREGEKVVFDFDEKLLAQRPLFLQLVLTKGVTISKAALGYATVTEEGGDGAVVFCGRLQYLVRSVDGRASRAQVLGHTMAHEIGHLLSIVKHEPTGIMRGQWDGRDCWRMGRGEMLFTAEEAARMRAAVRRRAGK